LRGHGRGSLWLTWECRNIQRRTPSNCKLIVHYMDAVCLGCHTVPLSAPGHPYPYPYIRIKIQVDISQREYMQLK